MRWDTLSVVVAVLVATLATAAQATFSETIYTTTMNGLNVLPYPTFVEASGATVCLLDRNQNALTCTVQTAGLEEVRTVHLSKGDAQSIGPIVYNFTRPLNHASFPTFFEETIALVDFPSYPIFQQKLDFLNGLWYIEAAAIDSVNDRIRGQLEQSDNYFSIMRPEETFPPAWGSPSHGIMLATYSRFVPERELAFDIVHDIQSPTRAQFRNGPRFEPGSFVYQTKSAVSPIIESVQLTLNEDRSLFEFGLFSQVYSAEYPQGEIRAQLSPVSVIPEVSFTSKLSSRQVNGDLNSQAEGCMLVVYDCDSNVLEYLIFHDAIQPTSVIFYVGEEGSSDSQAAFRGDGAVSPVYGRRVLDDTEEYYLLSQMMFVVVSTFEHPEGELRGQITARREFYAYFAGPQMVPSVTTAGLGCGTFTLDDETTFDYDILHNIKGATALELYVGSIGELGDREKVFRSPFSPLRGADVTVTDEFKKQLYLGRLYLVVKSEAFPDGEIRGQILRIKPCNAVPQFLPQTLTNPLVLTLGSGVAQLLPCLAATLSLVLALLFLAA